MAETETKFDPNTHTIYSRTTKDEGDVGRAQTTAKAQDASLIGAKKTGRGMLPGESVPQWKKRLADMDAAGDKSPQQDAFKGMMKPSAPPSPSPSPTPED